MQIVKFEKLGFGYYRVNVCITILSKIYFYFTAEIINTMLTKREEQRLR